MEMLSGRVTGHDPSNPVTVKTGSNSGTNDVSNINISSLNNPFASSLLIAARTCRRSTSSDAVPSGMTAIYFADGNGGNDKENRAPSFHVARQNIANTGATNTRNFTWSGAARSSGMMFIVNKSACSPAIGTPTFTLGTNSSRCQGAGAVTYTASSTGSTSRTYSLDATSLAAGNTINTTNGTVTYVAAYVGTSTITVTANGCQGKDCNTYCKIFGSRWSTDF